MVKWSVRFPGRPWQGGAERYPQNFTGYLQTDGYVTYEDFAVAEGITLLHCMAHARRKFHEALDKDEQRADYALEEIQKLSR